MLPIELYTQEAKALWDQLNAQCDNALELECLVTLTAAIQQAKRETWEEAATLLLERKSTPPHIGPLWNMGWSDAAVCFAALCRQRAREVQP
jgi:hypothetical protein